MTLKQLTFLSLFFCSLLSHSQYYKRSQLDSLKNALEKKEGIDRINSLLILSETYTNFQLDTALSYAKLAKEESMKIGYEWGCCKSIYCKAKAEKEFKKSGEIALVFKKCADWFTHNGFEKDGIRSQIIFEKQLFMNQGSEMAHDLALNTHARAEKLNDPFLLGMSWLQLQQFKPNLIDGEVYKGSFDSSAYYFEKTRDSMRITLVNLLAQKRLNSYTSNFDYLYEAKEKAIMWGNTSLIYATYWFLEISYMNEPNKDSVLKYHQMSSDLAENYSREQTKMVDPRILGVLYSSLDSLDLSLKYYNQSMDRINRFEINSDRSGLLRAIGEIQLRLGSYTESIETLLKVIDLSKKKKNDVDVYSVKIKLAELYIFMNEFEKAEEICLETIRWVDSRLTGEPRERLLFLAHLQLGKTYNEIGDYTHANENYEKSKIYKTDNALFSCESDLYIFHNYIDQNDIVNASLKYNEIRQKYSPSFYTQRDFFYLQKGRLLLNQKDYLNAIEALNYYILYRQTRTIDKDQRDAYYYFYEAYNAMGNKGKALESYLQYSIINDSLKTGRTIVDVQKIQSDNELSQKESEIQRLEQAQEISDLELLQRENEVSLGKLYITLLIFVFLIIGGAGYILFRRFRLKKEEEKKEIQRQSEIEKLKAQQKTELAEVKNNLYANISHEFKTPLTLIRVPLENFRIKAAEKDKKTYDSIIKNTDHLLEMLDELLGVSQMESGLVKLHATRFNLAHLLPQIKLNFAPLFTQKKIQFDWRVKLDQNDFLGDESKIQMVINNLLKNAYSNTPEEGWVNCEIYLKEELIIKVSNNGSEVSEEDLPYIFDRFYRSQNNEYSGSGIGLTWSKQIVELHNGTIHVENTKPNQVTFVLKIPISNAVDKIEDIQNNSIENQILVKNITIANEDVEQQQQQQQQQAQNLPSVLVVEDNLEMRELLNSVLKMHFKLVFAENGEIGEKMAIEIQPDLVLSDVMMPKKDGFELLKSLKENFNSSHIPVVLLTARSDSESRITGLNQDADDYIGKPFDPTELIARIDNLLRQRRSLHKLFSENPLLYSKQIKCTNIDADFIDQARKIMEENYANGDFTARNFCLELSLNRTSVNNKIKALTNQSTAAYIKNFRLEKAAKMLIETQANITEVYIDNGFNSPQSFNKAFKKKIGCSPSEYRTTFFK